MPSHLSCLKRLLLEAPSRALFSDHSSVVFDAIFVVEHAGELVVGDLDPNESLGLVVFPEGGGAASLKIRVLCGGSDTMNSVPQVG